MEALAQLTVSQIAEMSATPGQLTTPAQVNTVMGHIPNQQLSAFFDDFSPAIEVSFVLNTNFNSCNVEDITFFTYPLNAFTRRKTIVHQ